VTISGTRCRQCGLTVAHRQYFGCESCGAYGDDLVRRELEAEGRVLSAIRVERHPDTSVATPLTIVRVHLLEGPAIRAEFRDDRVNTAPAIGTAVRLRPAQGSPDRPTFELAEPTA
jgi:uncharacterized OB-fold protein